MGLQDQVGPQLRLDPERQIGAPMIEESRDPARHIDRNELMPRPRRQPLFEEMGRGDRSGGKQDFERGPRLQQPVNQRQQRGRLADARGVHPDERPARPDLARDP